jgi:hypothetical protein
MQPLPKLQVAHERATKAAPAYFAKVMFVLLRLSWFVHRTHIGARSW